MTPARPFALLFDLDGTLVDSLDLILESFRHACATHLGRVPPDAEWIAGMGRPLDVQMRHFTADDEQVARLVAAYRGYQREHHDRLLREFDGVRDTLGVLRQRGHPTALVTSKIVELAERALEFTGLREHLDVVIGCDICQRHKPDPEPVFLALERLGRTPAEAIFVGDSPHDVAAGNAAGVTTVAALWGPFDRETLERAAPTYLLSRITDLPTLVERIEAATAAD